jgi:hypothetical protein
MSATPLKIHDNERDAAEESFPDFSFKISCAIWVCQSTTTTLYKIHIPDIFFYYSPNKRREKKEKKNTSGILLVVFVKVLIWPTLHSKPADGAKRIK